MNLSNNENDIYPFKPQMYKNNKYNNQQSHYSNNDEIINKINEDFQKKNDKIKKMKNLKEEKEMLECVFRPKINKKSYNFESGRPVVVKGADRYIEQMKKNRQEKLENEERIKKIFKTGENWTINNTKTMPRPFKLSNQNNCSNCVYVNYMPSAMSASA